MAVESITPPAATADPRIDAGRLVPEVIRGDFPILDRTVG
jgi:hypothetical protein